MPFASPSTAPSGAPARTDQNYRLSEAESSSTGTTVSAWAQVGGELRATLMGAGTATYDPDACDYVEWVLRDAGGDAVAIELEDVISVLMRIRKLLPTDAFAMAVLTSGGLASAGGGGAVGLRHHASGPTAIDCAHAGASWDAVTEATAREAITRCASMSVAQSNGISGARLSCTPVDGGLRPATTTNSTTSPGLSNIELGGKFDHVAIVVGWAGVGGTNGATTTVGVSTYVERSQNLPGRLGLFEASPVAAGGPWRKFAVIGNSQVGTGGSGVDADRGGDPVPSSVDFGNGGADITNYPNECASRPYFVDEVVAQPGWEAGTPDYGWVEWWGADGLAMTPPAAWRALLGQLFDAVAARDDGDPDAVVVHMAENDAASAEEAADYLEYTRDALRAVRYEYPNAWIFLIGMSDADTGNPSYAFREVLRAHQQSLAAELGNCTYVSLVGAPLSDDVHLTTGSGGGHNISANRVGAYLPTP